MVPTSCVQHRKIGVEIVWETLIAVKMIGSWEAHLASPAYFFARADDITKEREPEIKIINALIIIVHKYFCPVYDYQGSRLTVAN